MNHQHREKPDILGSIADIKSHSQKPELNLTTIKANAEAATETDLKSLERRVRMLEAPEMGVSMALTDDLLTFIRNVATMSPTTTIKMCKLLTAKDEEIERLRENLQTSEDNAGELQQCFDELMPENKQLREALVKYGCHTERCIHSGVKKCNCGYHEALKGNSK